jgi:hypothetical protein
MEFSLFTRSDWNREWLYDTALAVGTMNAFLVGGGVDDVLSGAGVSSELSFLGALCSMALCVVVAVALARIPDTTIHERLPALGDAPNQFRLFKIPAAVVFPFFGTFALVTVVANAVSLPVAIGVLFVVANVAAILSSSLLVSRRHSRRQHSGMTMP